MSLNQILLPLCGGALIGLAASVLLLFNGRILGVTGILAGTMKSEPGDKIWRLAFIAGLVLGGLGLIALRYPAFETVHLSSGTAIVAGLLVGFGTRLGNGCTSGHGVCGLSRFSIRSVVATITFIATGALTVFVMRTFFGGAS